MTLLPYGTGSAALTLDSTSGTFASAPTLSYEGRFLALSGKDDMYRITQHTAGATSFQIDSPFLLATGSYSFNAYKLDYQAVNNTIVVDSTNNKIDFVGTGGTLVATLTAGSYSPATLCTEIVTRLTAADAGTYTATFDDITRKFTIAHGGAVISLLFASGTNVTNSAGELLGFECLDYTGALTYSSVYALSGILRVTKPITTYREAPVYGQAAKEAGKIFYLDSNTLSREFPLSRLEEAMPSKFTIAEQTSSGIWTLRFSGSVVDESARAELHYIPITRDLQNNAASIPKVPTPYTKFLVWAASYHLLMEKSDSKAENYFKMAQAQLRALVNDSKKAVSLGGNNYGRIIPRANRNRYYGFRT